MQGTARPGGWPSTNLPYNETAVFTITFYLSTGITSRGRIGINSDLKGMPIVQPWFQDPTDKSVLIRGITEAIAGMESNCTSTSHHLHHPPITVRLIDV
jgi:cellobiose dehydrogenase (acceptor)